MAMGSEPDRAAGLVYERGEDGRGREEGGGEDDTVGGVGRWAGLRIREEGGAGAGTNAWIPLGYGYSKKVRASRKEAIPSAAMIRSLGTCSPFSRVTEGASKSIVTTLLPNSMVAPAFVAALYRIL